LISNGFFKYKPTLLNDYGSGYPVFGQINHKLGDNMRDLLIRLLLLFCFSVSASAYADTCKSDDYSVFVSGKEQCLVIRKFGTEKPKVMVIWLHGDVSSGGPANYHFPLAKRFADEHSAEKVLSVALVRPGYPDGEGNTSSVSFFNSGRQDHYTKTNITEVANAIDKLKNQFQPSKVILVGHSGGAATAALILGMFPNLANGAVLVSCPCDLTAWRVGRRAWSASENPLNWVSHVSPQSNVYALTGDRDDNTSPQLAMIYVTALKEAKVTAEFQLLENESHNSAFRSPAVFLTLRKFIDNIPQPIAAGDAPQASRP
jgi:predicted esterase